MNKYSKLRVLIVDDNMIMRSLIKQCLNNIGITIAEKENFINLTVWTMAGVQRFTKV